MGPAGGVGGEGRSRDEITRGVSGLAAHPLESDAVRQLSDVCTTNPLIWPRELSYNVVQMSDSVQISVRVPSEVFREIATESRSRGESISDAVRRRLAQSGDDATLDDHERRIAALEEMANRAY
jgi:CRP-like cAMP-binding protein